jgi:hemerythrin-like domain-containing protein
MQMTLPAAIVDITTRAAAAATVLSDFDALAPGEAMLLRSAAPPEAALKALRQARAGAFEWTPLVEGPDRWEVEVHRLDARVGVLRGVREALGWDHGRLDGLEEAAVAAWKAGQAQSAARLHLRFVHGLLRHIRFEESVLFPEFERVTRMPPDQGPTAVMRLEHRMIQECLAQLKDAAERGERPAETVRAELRGILEPHDEKEEHVLYPMLDRALDPRAADEIVYRFQSMGPA